MYKCDGTACSYNYSLLDNMPSCPYTYCCKQRDTWGNTSCYQWQNNSSYKDNEEDAARCKAAAMSVQTPTDCSYNSSWGCSNKNENGPGFYRQRTYTGGVYVNACGDPQYEAVSSTGYFVTMYTNSYDRCGYSSSNSTPCCDYISPGTPGYSYEQAGWTCNGYYSGSYAGSYMPVCQEESQYPRTYYYNGTSMKFSEYCYKKYNIWTYCSGQKYAGSANAIQYGWDYNGR